MKKEKSPAEEIMESKKANHAFDELILMARKKDALISVEEIPVPGADPLPSPDLVFSPVPKPLPDFKTAQIPLFK